MRPPLTWNAWPARTATGRIAAKRITDGLAAPRVLAEAAAEEHWRRAAMATQWLSDMQRSN